MDTGDVYCADLGEETRRHVLVLSGAQFHRRSSRVLVAPEFRGADVEELLPWRIRVGELVFAVDHIRTVEADLLLDERGAAPFQAVARARRALLAIT
ncbi:type II toxin-antitoxin system PemK/MazF family toxin [Iamia sp. SCSIO 61187]|uniref:type II toxin-antitoxin system PemK/MazF family toxin n=1 Tax=Iamia sp. SCSIO 61187 TaxID=2722752 RepID=UPI001C639305|nr:type II toxin-antitoxin system PemK/MazF family toxin [Iamia sp. SCSIO 61187]QYG92984.1 type II toxin-antitoxin system PemK/MazF family toxin [Iamia sp. SCSIO 61187]